MDYPDEDTDGDGDVVEPSLDRLSQAFAEAMGRSVPAPEDAPERPASEEETREADAVAVDHGCPLSPKSVLEAILFVGHPDNAPILASDVADLLRGVDEQEVVELVAQLNRAYESESLPMVIAAVGNGFRLQLREEFAYLRQRFYGRVRQTRLSQLAIDVLAVIAYNQPVTRDQLDELLQHHGAQVTRTINLLVRRGLVGLRMTERSKRSRQYVTTERFLQLFGLDDLGDLPRSDDPQ